MNFPSVINEFRISGDVPFAGSDTGLPASVGEDYKSLVIRRDSLANVPSTLRRLRRQLCYDVGDGFLIEPRASHANNDQFAFHIDHKAREIRLDCSDEYVGVAATWILHAGFGTATLLHGGLPLHAAGLSVGDRYVGLMASSGTGKSTLTWYLLQNGLRFGNDDLIPAYPGTDGVTAYPASSRYPKLMREVCDHFGLNLAHLIPADYGTDEKEYYAPLPLSDRCTVPTPLSALYLLTPDETLDAEQVHTEVVPPDDAATLIREELHAAWIVGKYFDTRRLMRLCRQVTEAVPVYRLRYRRSYAVLPRLADVLHGGS